MDTLPAPHLLLHLARLLSATPCVVALFDEQDRLHWANPAFRRMFGLGPDELPTWPELMRRNRREGTGTSVQAGDFEAWLASARSRRGKQPFRKIEADLMDGRWNLMTETVDDRGWMLCFGVDITDLDTDVRQLRADRDQARRLAQADSLTGIGNRRFVLDGLRVALQAPEPAPLCIAMADLDHFKQVNDRLGHAAGDAVLVDFARRLQAGVRRADLCGRLGGEEFLLVLRGVDEAGAAEVLERLMAQLRSAAPLPDWPGLRYTASFGLARARPGDSAEALLARADAALYAAKQAGRDRMVCAPEPD